MQLNEKHIDDQPALITPTYLLEGVSFLEQIETSIGVMPEIESTLTEEGKEKLHQQINENPHWIPEGISRIQLCRQFLANIVTNLHDPIWEKLNLRTNQMRSVQKFIEFLRNAAEGNPRGYFRQPTGAGKTVLMGTLTKLINVRTLIFAPNVELLYQTKDEFVKILGYSPEDIGIVGGDQNEQDKPIVLSTYKSSHKIDGEFPLIFCDEGHQSMGDWTQENIEKISGEEQFQTNEEGLESFDSEKYSNSLVIALTASPNLRLKKMKDYFNTLIAISSYKELIEANYLVPKVMDLDAEIFTEDLKHGTNVILTEEETQIINREKLHERAINQWLELNEQVDNLQTAVFCATIDQAEKFRDLANKQGLRAGVYTSRVKDVSGFREIEEKLASGDLDFIVFVGKGEEGWNYLPLNCIITLRVTLSPRKLIQPVGRSIRKDENKECAYLIQGRWRYVRNQKIFNTPNGIDSHPENDESETIQFSLDLTTITQRPPLTFQDALIAIGEEIDGVVSNINGQPVKVHSIDQNRKLAYDQVKSYFQSQFNTYEEWAEISPQDRRELYKNSKEKIGLGAKAICSFIIKTSEKGSNPVDSPDIHKLLGAIIWSTPLEETDIDWSKIPPSMHEKGTKVIKEKKETSLEEALNWIQFQTDSYQQWIELGHSAKTKVYKNSKKEIELGSKALCNLILGKCEKSDNPIDNINIHKLLGAIAWNIPLEKTDIDWSRIPPSMHEKGTKVIKEKKETSLEEALNWIQFQTDSYQQWAELKTANRRSLYKGTKTEIQIGTNALCSLILGKCEKGNNPISNSNTHKLLGAIAWDIPPEETDIDWSKIPTSMHEKGTKVIVEKKEKITLEEALNWIKSQTDSYQQWTELTIPAKTDLYKQATKKTNLGAVALTSLICGKCETSNNPLSNSNVHKLLGAIAWNIPLEEADIDWSKIPTSMHEKGTKVVQRKTKSKN